MKIDRKLNLVIPVEQDDGTTVYVYAQPLAREVFERYFMVIARTFSEIYNSGLGITAGPRVAALTLRSVAEDMKRWDGPAGVQAGLVADMRRTSLVLAPSDAGWVPVTLQEALDRGTMSDDDASEVENALAFFTVASAMHRKSELKPILDGACGLWGAQVTYSTSTEFASSLRTPTPGDSSGGSGTQSSPPS